MGPFPGTRFEHVRSGDETVGVTSTIRFSALPPYVRRARHEHRVERFSRDYRLLTDLRHLGADRDTATRVVDHVCSTFSVPAPELTFHRGRSAHTGYCVPPRRAASARNGADAVDRWEAAHEPWPFNGMIRLGDPTSLATIAHEAGHHLVHCLERANAPAHGKVWVGRFDDAAAAIATLLDR